jgi:hypothetical protein
MKIFAKSVINNFMFKQLKNKFNLEAFEIESHKIRFGNVLSNNKFDGISYEYLKNNDDNNAKIFGVLPERYRDKFSLLLMRVSSSPKPHIDSKVLTAINFYIQPADATTFFYKIISDNPKEEQCKVMQSRNSGKSFPDVSDLEVVGSFKALPNDAYLLDVSKIHSVLKPNKDDVRIAFALQTNNFTFVEVCDMLVETGNL